MPQGEVLVQIKSFGVKSDEKLSEQLTIREQNQTLEVKGKIDLTAEVESEKTKNCYLIS